MPYSCLLYTSDVYKRQREDGGYELIAGHRRKHACELAGLATMPVIVRDIDRDAATIRRWAGEDAKKAAPPTRNRDYSVKEDETV